MTTPTASRRQRRWPLRRPRPTVRLRLTVLYGGLFLVAGAALLAATYLLVERATGQYVIVNGQPDPSTATAPTRQGDGANEPFVSRSGSLDEALARLDASEHAAAERLAQRYRDAIEQQETFLDQLLSQSALALGAMAVLAMGLGWLVAGRVLRPLRTMASTAQCISEHSLHQRLAVTGPDDEVKHLADTIDRLLGRLETAFDAQRRFVANASHELRTPLTLDRALLEVTLTDPHATAAELRATCQDLLESGRHQQRLLDGLLVLAASERGLDRRTPFDLADRVTTVVQSRHTDASDRGVRLCTQLDDAPMAGNPELMERLAANLVDNAVRYNHPGGEVHVATWVDGDDVVLRVANTGPHVPPADVERLLQPFQRHDGQRSTHPDGHGLGLSIVQAIATAHEASLTVEPRPGGGLSVEARLPAARSHDPRPRSVPVA